MNEIEHLRRFRDELPPTREVSREAARAVLLKRIEGRPSSIGRALGWRPRHVRLALVATGSAALAIALSVTIFSGGGRVESAAAQALHEVATVAAAQKPVVPGPGQFLYTRSKGAYLQATDRWSVQVPSVEEIWSSLDGSRNGRTRHVSGKPRFVSGGQRAKWVVAGSPPLPPAGRVEDSANSGGGSFIDASGLSTEPKALRETIEAREIPGVDGPPGEAETFTLIGDMLREAYLPSAVRSALYEAAAELPEIELLGEVDDPVGRSGTAIAYSDRKRGTRNELIFDPDTSELLGERVSLVRSGAFGFEAPPGTEIGYVAYLESKVVDSVGKGAPPQAGAVDTTVYCYDRAALDANTAIVHGADPIATCGEVWREGAMDTRRGPASPPLVACSGDDSSIPAVFPGPDPSVCHRLGLVPFERNLP